VETCARIPAATLLFFFYFNFFLLLFNSLTNNVCLFEYMTGRSTESKEGSRMGGGEGEQGWRYTWEAQSHVPTLRLMVFPNDKTLNPSLHCHDLAINLHSSHSLLTLTTSSLSLRVPLPAVLLDADSPVTFRPLSDHIEVKLLLLLPVDHPILSSLHPSPTPLPDPLVSESGNV